MRIIRSGVIAVLASATMFTAAADAQTRTWSLSFDAGTQAALDGDVHSGGSGVVLGLPTQVSAKSFGDVYGQGFYWNAGLGLGVGEQGEIRVNGNYINNPADRLQVGTVSTLPLFALFDDYTAFGMDVGYRQYLGGARARPFVGAGIGFVWLDDVSSEFSVPDADVVLPGVAFFESSIVPAFNFGAGVQVRATDAIAFQGGIDFRWHGAADDVDGLAGTGLESINDDRSRWSMPITAGLTIRF